MGDSFLELPQESKENALTTSDRILVHKWQELFRGSKNLWNCIPDIV
jgi:hypothetical protein